MLSHRISPLVASIPSVNDPSASISVIVLTSICLVDAPIAEASAAKAAALSAGRNDLEHQADLFARSEEHTSELQSLMRISYAVFCLKKKKKITTNHK